MKKTKHVVPFRRKTEGKTNYKKRLSLLKSDKPRLVVRPSLKNIIAQIVIFEPKGDKVLLSVHSRKLLKLGWKAGTGNVPAAYLIGMIVGKEAKSKGIKTAILDLGLKPSVKASRIYAVVKGAKDAGLDIPCSSEILPGDDRINGKHIAEYAKKLGKGSEEYKKQYSSYIKNSFDVEKIAEHFKEIKAKI